MLPAASIVPYNILPAKMGGQKGIAIFNEYISKHIDLTCITVKSNAPELSEGYTILNVFSNSLLRYINVFYFFKVKNILRKRGIKHLIIEHPYYGWLGIMLKYFSNIKLIVHSHNIEFLRFKSTGKWWWWILKWYEKIVYRSADFVFFITDEDRNYAIGILFIKANQCAAITYGIEISEVPALTEKMVARHKLLSKYNIPEKNKILLFNGTLTYGPNLDALNIILNHINPLLLKSEFNYKIIICGKGLPKEYNNLQAYVQKNIIYAGFVEDISTYFKGADIFLNPLIDGGGIKTKLVEAIGYNMNAASTESGAIGVPKNICNNKLLVSEDGDWASFCSNILSLASYNENTGAAYFTHFYWGAIAKNAAKILNDL
jgi:polysaccharide biosynthesis protein PslH